MDSFLSAIVPRAEVTFSDILDEQEREAKKEAQALRAENQRLQHASVALLWPRRGYRRGAGNY